jgi:DNA-binding response OmpR family regulator
MVKILLVEDNELNQDMLSRRLLRRGYEVAIAIDGALGVSMAISEKPDLILMDMSLPVMNGWEATRLLKGNEQTQSIPVIALTAHAMVGEREKALEAGCDDYDTKPVELQRLLQKVEFLLANRVPDRQTESETPHNTEHPPMAQQSDLAKTVLLVDDNEMNRDMLSRRLQRAGYIVLLANSGEEGLDSIRQQSIDLVLLDIMMPGIGGLETLRRIRNNYSKAKLPVIMATAKDQSNDVVQAFELGANDYITKPIDFPIALARIQAQLSTIQSARQEQVTESATPLSTNQSATPISTIQPAQQKQVAESATPLSAIQPSRQAAVTIEAGISLLNGRYKIIKEFIGDEFSQIHLAQDTQLPGNSSCLINHLLLDIDKPYLVESTRSLFQTELASLAQLGKDEKIPSLLDSFEQDRNFYLVQEFVEGTLLTAELKSGQQLGAVPVLLLIIDILVILELFHRHQAIHQNIQPNSIMRRKQDTKLILIDSGIAMRMKAALHRDRSPQKVINKGLGYTAIEQFRNQPSFSSDIYSVGMIALQALTGKHPSEFSVDPATGEIRWRHLATVNNDFARVLDTMISQHPEKRYPTVGDILKDISRQMPLTFKALQFYRPEHADLILKFL